MVIFQILAIVVICFFTYAILKDSKQQEEHQARLLREEWLKKHRRKGAK